MPRFPGILPALTTPFAADGAVDLAALQDHAAALLAAGVHGFVATGTMGEAGSLTRDERAAVVAAVVEAAEDRVPVLAGVSAGTPADATAFARDAASAGVAGLMLLPPLGYRGDAREIVAHFAAVAAATDLPVMAYNNPEASGTDMAPSLIARLAGRGGRRRGRQGVLGRRAADRRAARRGARRWRSSSAATTGRWRGSAPAPRAGCPAWPAARRPSASSSSTPAAPPSWSAPGRSTRACCRSAGST